MLAVQRLSMGSSKPPNPDMPFGYSFDTAGDDFPFPTPPAPAPGPSLLDDDESTILNTFFDGLNADQFNPDFFSAVGDGGDNMDLGWRDIPPAFMGTTSSFGQHPQPITSNLQGMTYPDLSGNISSTAGILGTSPSAEVLAAASLLQNGHSGRRQIQGHDPLFIAHSLSQGTPDLMSRPLMNYDQRSDDILRDDDYIRDTMFTEMMFGSTPNARHYKERPKAADIRWGSDSGFDSGQGFIAPSNQETMEVVEQHMSNTLGCFAAQPSTAGSTRPSSPIITRHPEPQAKQHEQTSVQARVVDKTNEQRAKKRSKENVKEEPEEDEEIVVSDKTPQRRKPKQSTSAVAPSTTQLQPPSKRRKSGASASARALRENLTEDQKRENHIKSEQKRRTLIKEGFDDLGELVPELKGGGFSKSAVLLMAADWLEDLIEGNRVLKRRVIDLQNQKGS